MAKTEKSLLDELKSRETQARIAATRAAARGDRATAERRDADASFARWQRAQLED